MELDWREPASQPVSSSKLGVADGLWRTPVPDWLDGLAHLPSNGCFQKSLSGSFHLVFDGYVATNPHSGCLWLLV